MIYKLKFEAAPREIQFELLQGDPVTVRDVLRITKFNIKNSTTLVAYLRNRKMKESELIVYDKITRKRQIKRQYDVTFIIRKD